MEEEMAVHRHLDDELDVLRSQLVKMGDLVDEQFAGAVNALLNRNEELAEEVYKRDDEVDALEIAVDQQCERILALHQPVADELRMIITAVKINTDLERIGDHCKNIAKNTPYLVHNPDALAATRLNEMADISRSMLRKVQDAFLQSNRLEAQRVLATDQQVDRIHRENFHALLSFGEKHPEAIEAVAHLLTASKALERIADHAKNIAESVIFLIEAIDVRHRRLSEEEKGAERPSRGTTA